MKKLLFVLNLLSYLLYPHTLHGVEITPIKCGCTLVQYTDKTWELEVYQTEKGQKNVKLWRTNLKSEKEAYRLCKQWRELLAKHHSQTVPYQALLKKK